MRKIEIELDGKIEKVFALQAGTELWVHVRGETRVVDLKPKKKSRGNDSQSSLNEITSPMPGRILKVNCGVGDTVSERQVLVVMEAMKMEYSLECPASGVVDLIRCQDGQQVELGQLLVRINPSEKK